MGKSKFNGYLIGGYIAFFIVFGIGHFISFPEFVRGLLIGLCISLVFIGVYAMNHDMDKVKEFKKNMIRKIFGRSNS